LGLRMVRIYGNHIIVRGQLEAMVMSCKSIMRKMSVQLCVYWLVETPSYQVCTTTSLAYPHKVFQFCIKVSSAASAIGSCFQLLIHKSWGSWADSLIETMLNSMQWSPQGVDMTKSTVGIPQSDLSLCELRCL